ncbi:MAG: N-acetyltransferase family protein [Chitinivibrionales bacterium]
MNTDLTIRCATLDDIPGMLSLLQSLFAIEKDFCWDPGLQSRGLKMLICRAMHGDATVQVAESVDRIVAMGTCQIRVSTAIGGFSGVIEDIIVMEQWRRRGAGKQILAALSRWARDQGCQQVQLLADNENKNAHAFYTRQGWFRSRMECWKRVLV